MTLIPTRFLFRLAYPCRYIKGMPHPERDDLLDLPEDCRIDTYAGLDGQRVFGELRIAWNELGIGVQARVSGKSQALQCDAARAKGSDGLTLWLDTRDARSGHRATRYCHQIHLLPGGGGSDGDLPVFTQSKINRALQDAPINPQAHVATRTQSLRGGYVLEAFLTAEVLNGFDPELNKRLGFFYVIRDAELGTQTLGLGADFPYWEDPSLWSVLELTR
jgi:hypothetical protein